MIRLTELIEGSFGKSGKVTHVMDVPMFSVFVPTVKVVPQKMLVMRYGEQIKRECNKARNEIHRIGFPSMHANIVMKDLSKEPNQNTGAIGIGGRAYHYKKYMEVDVRNFTAETIVHEWAHLWMMNNSKDFKKAVKTLYSQLMKDAGVKIDTTKGIDKPISNEDEIKILDMWGEGITKMFGYLSMDRAANAYSIKGKKITPDLFPKLPHLLQFDARLKRPTYLSSLKGTSKTLPAGSKVYVAKGNSGWLIGTEIENSRYEILTSTYDELLDYVESNQSGDIFTDIQVALQKNNLRNRQYNTPKYLENKLNEEIKNGLGRILEDTARKFNVRVSPEEIKTVQSWSQYILPKYLKTLRSSKLFAYYQTNPKKIYDSMWVSNEHKPAGLSFVKFFITIINRGKGETFQKDFADKSSFVGKEFHQHRETMAELNSWVNSYGMSNEDELWATAIEYFFKLPEKYRKIIVKIMMYD